MSLPQELFEESYAVPFQLFQTNLDKLEIFLYARMWDDYEYHVRKHGFYAPFRGRLAAYVGSEREDTATSIVGRLISKGYVIDTGKRFNNRPIYEVIDFRTIEGVIIKPSIADRSYEKVKERMERKAENDFHKVNELDENRKTISTKSENDGLIIGKRVHSLYNSPSSSLSKDNIITEEKEVTATIKETPHKEELKEDSKFVSLPSSDNSLPPIATSQMEAAKVFNQGDFLEWLKVNQVELRENKIPHTEYKTRFMEAS